MSAELSENLSMIESQTIGSTAMMFGPGNLERALQIAEAMSSAKVSVPAHLRNQPGDCLAIVMQATQWGMNPFAVAQKTHLVNGTLGYEAQLVNAVVQTSRAIRGRFHYEYSGEAESMQCRVGAVIAGETDITWGEWLAARFVTTKNSPLWKTNPKQQMGYLQVKNWARAYCPGAILGVYTVDELEPPATRDMGTIDRETGEVHAGEQPKLPQYTQAQLDANSDVWRTSIKAGKTTPEKIIQMISKKYTLADDQIKQINDLSLPAIDAEFVKEMNETEAAQ